MSDKEANKEVKPVEAKESRDSLETRLNLALEENEQLRTINKRLEDDMVERLRLLEDQRNTITQLEDQKLQMSVELDCTRNKYQGYINGVETVLVGTYGGRKRD